MNFTLIYLVFLIAIFIFLIAFYLQYNIHYNKKNLEIQNKEHFQCAPNNDDLFYLEIDNEIQACFNYIYNYETVAGDQLFIFDGINSFVFIRDFLHNLFEFELKVKFNEISLLSPTSKILLNSKFLLIYTFQKKLHVKYNNNDLNVLNFSNVLDSIETYKLKIKQTTNQIKVFFGDNNMDERDFSNTVITFNTEQEQKCDFSSGNEIYIGCNRAKNGYLNALIGEIKVIINKRKFDDYLYIGDTIPSDLTCQQQITRTLIVDQQPFLTVPTANNFNEYGKYIEIYLSNTINDLKVKYLDIDSRENNIIRILNRERITKIKNVFQKLVAKEDLFTNKNRFILEKSVNDTFFSGGYHNLNDDNENIIYLFSLNEFKNQNIIQKLKFLDLKTIKRRFNVFNESHILIYGKKTDQSSFFRFLKLQKPIFIIIYKNSDDENYFYEQVSININLFYEFHKNYLIHKINNQNIDELTQYEGFINALEPGLSLNIDNENNTLVFNNKPIEYNKNFFRLYDTEINLGISVSIYNNNSLEKTIFVNYKNASIREQCRFIPSGETIFDCIRECNDSKFFSCGISECKNICNNCKNKECKWNVVDIEKMNKFKPSAINIKGFSGDKQIKLTWIKPLSSYPIISYYIILENIQRDKQFDMYVYDGKEDMIEFIISNLQNTIPYKFYVFSKNSSGVSDVSNSVTIIPQKNKLLDVRDEKVKRYSDSLQSYNNMFGLSDSQGNFVNIDNNVIALQNLQELNELQNVLVEKINENENISNNLNINIY
jgi:hypothetical protein